MSIKKFIEETSVREYIGTAHFRHNKNNIDCYVFRLCMPLVEQEEYLTSLADSEPVTTPLEDDSCHLITNGHQHDTFTTCDVSKDDASDCSLASYHSPSASVGPNGDESCYETASETCELLIDKDDLGEEDVVEQEYVPDMDDLALMQMMGLPTSFGKGQTSRQNANKKKKKPKPKRPKNKDGSLVPKLTAFTLTEQLQELITVEFHEDILYEPDNQDKLDIILSLDLSTLDSLGLECSFPKPKQEYFKMRQKKVKVPEELRHIKDIEKHYKNRYDHFSRYDEGIHLSDEEAWFSVTPEKMAKNMALACQGAIVLDGFCGAGGNAIQFGVECPLVFAIDIAEEKLNMAKHNASIYQVNNIEFVQGNFLEISKRMTADVVFLSPPWGGPNYKKSEGFGLDKIDNFDQIMSNARDIASNIALFLPKNTILEDLVKYSDQPFVVEQNYLADFCKGITVYYGELFLEFFRAQM